MGDTLMVRSREELIFLLCEASELEHLLMCEYLFAAFSLKQSVDEGLTTEQAEAVQRWERVVSGVAVQEMLHLAQASNLLTAVGGMPHLRRPNFPQRSNYFPPEVQLALLPFGDHSLRHFIFLERPEGLALKDAPEFVRHGPHYQQSTGAELVPVPQNFLTVGELYRAIEDGFRLLVQKYGEEQVFVGPKSVQATGEYFRWDDLVAVTDLESASHAIEFIVEQGEGARGNWQNAHYGKFLNVYQELQDMLRSDPAFEPARPVIAVRPRLPHDVLRGPITTDIPTVAVADLFNGCYEVLLEVMLRFFLHDDEDTEDLEHLADIAVNSMFELIRPLGTLLTRLPAGREFPGKTAGPTFDIFRRSYILPHRAAARQVLHERFLELAEGAGRITRIFDQPDDAQAGQTIAGVEVSLRRFASAFE